MSQGQCSELFADVFDSRCGGARRTCECGRTFFDYTDSGCFEEGEFEELQAKSIAEPDKYCAVDHTVGTIEIGGVQIVYGCTCELAAKYERFIRANARRIAEYLRGYAAQLHAQADAVDCPEAQS
jgi:hypothetical protein